MKKPSRCYPVFIVITIAVSLFLASILKADLEINIKSWDQSGKKIKETYRLTVTAGLYRGKQQEEKAYMTFPKWNGEKLTLNAADFKKGNTVFGFWIDSQPETPKDARWVVNNKSITFPGKLELIRPHSRNLRFRFGESIRFKASLEKKIEGSISWVLSRKGLDDKKIEIPFLIIPKPNINEIEKNVHRQKQEINGHKEEINRLNTKLEQTMSDYENLKNQYREKIEALEKQVKHMKQKDHSPGNRSNPTTKETRKDENGGNGLILYLFGLLSGLAVFGAFMSFKWFKRSNKNQTPKKHKTRTGKEIAGTVHNINNRKVPPKDKGEQNKKKTPPAKNQTDEPEFSFSLRTKETAVMTQDDFYMVTRQNSEYFKVDVRKMWKNSAVTAVHLKRPCLVEMDICVTRSYESHRIPETAGFLLGRHSECKDNTGRTYYEAVCEVFIPAKHIRCTDMEVVFPAETFRDLASNAENYRELDIIGWFHTHPRWGVFLSDRDEDIQKNHFKEPWQIAVVADSIANKTGIFTWDDQHQLNNTEREHDKREFLPWDDFKQWLRTGQ